MKALRITGFTLAAILAMLVLVAIFFDWNALRGPVARAIEARTGRAVEIEHLDIRWRLHPVIVVDGFSLGNADWASAPSMLRVDHASASVSLPRLITGKLVFPAVEVSGARLELERRDGRGNWTFKDRDEERKPPSIPRIDRLDLRDSSLHYRDAAQRTDLSLRAGTEAGPSGNRLVLVGDGRARGEAVALRAEAPATIGTGADDAAPLSASLQHGATRLAARGTIADLQHLDGVDLAVEGSGQSLEDVAKLMGLPLPDTPPYAVAGRVRGGRDCWDIADLRLKLGQSTLGGQMVIQPAAPSGQRPRVDAALVSDSLDIGDLRTLFGAPPKAGERRSPRQQQEAAELKAKGKAVPEKPFNTAAWRRMDARVRLDARRVLKAPVLPVEALSFEANLEDGNLRIDPLRITVAGGQVAGNAVLDARRDPLAASVDLEFNALQLGRLIPPKKNMVPAKGSVYGRSAIKARGNSATALLASANGRFSLTLNGGQVSNLVLEAAGLDAAEALRLFASGDKPIRVRCMVADFDIDRGFAKSRALVFDTDDTLLVGEGGIDLGQEQVDLTAHPEPKDKSPLVFRTPLHVRGRFRDLSVRPDIPTLATRGGAALLLGLVNPLLALAPLIETGPGWNSDCAGLLQQARGWNPEKETAPKKTAGAPAADASSGSSSTKEAAAPGKAAAR